MNFLSLLKAVLLKGVDAYNGAPLPFSRPMQPQSWSQSMSESGWRDLLAEKAEQELEGFVSDGAFICQKPNDLGDAAIWQGVYTAMCAVRWSTGRAEDARIKLLSAAVALSRYLHDGCIHRGALPTNLRGAMFELDPSKKYYEVEGITYRDDASLDSLVGVMFGAAAVIKFGDAEAAGIVQQAVKKFSDRFTANKFKLVSGDGTLTKYGNCTPSFFQAPVRTLAACLPSLVCRSAAGEWQFIAKQYKDEFSTTDTQIPKKMSWVNAHLAILASLTYAMAIKEGELGRTEIRYGLEKLLDKYADAGNAFLIFGCDAVKAPVASSERELGRKVLMEFPLGPKQVKAELPNTLQPIPVWQRPPCDIVWQRSPYTGSGEEANAYTKLDYLIAHYLSKVV